MKSKHQNLLLVISCLTVVSLATWQAVASHPDAGRAADSSCQLEKAKKPAAPDGNGHAAPQESIIWDSMSGNLLSIIF